MTPCCPFALDNQRRVFGGEKQSVLQVVHFCFLKSTLAAVQLPGFLKRQEMLWSGERGDVGERGASGVWVSNRESAC